MKNVIETDREDALCVAVPSRVPVDEFTFAAPKCDAPVCSDLVQLAPGLLKGDYVEGV